MAQKRKKCIIRGCKNPDSAMRCCQTHYTAFYRLVKSGETTWEELEKNGYCKRTRRRSNARAIVSGLKAKL